MFCINSKHLNCSGIFNEIAANGFDCTLVDMLNIQNLISNVKSSSPENFDDILDIILPMVEKDKPSDKLSFDRKQSISKAAESVFAEFGYKNATISAIARKAKISEGNIYEHFKNKKNLLINGIEEQIKSTINFIDDLSKKNNSERQLRDFMLFFSIPYLKRPDALKTLIYSAMYNKIFYQSSAFKTFTKLFDRMDTMLIDGKETGTFRKEINPRIIKNIFLGAFCHLTLRWDCQQQGPPTYRLEKINLLIDMICKAIS